MTLTPSKPQATSLPDPVKTLDEVIKELSRLRQVHGNLNVIINLDDYSETEIDDIKVDEWGGRGLVVQLCC